MSCQYRVISFCESGAVNVHGRGSHATYAAAEREHDRLSEKYVHAVFDIQRRSAADQPWHVV